MTQKLISEELYFQNNTATLFHRTKSSEMVKNILNSKWVFGNEKAYGSAIYTTLDEASQKQNAMLIYGNYIIKFKYTKLDKLLIFDSNIAREMYDDKYTIKDQLTKLNVIDKLNISEEELDEFQKDLEFGSYPQNEHIIKFLERYIVSGKSSLVDGIILDGKHLGSVVVIYPPCKNLYPIAWAYAPRGVEKFVWKPLINSKGSEALRLHGMAELPVRNVNVEIGDDKLNFNKFIKFISLDRKHSQKSINYFFSKLLGDRKLTNDDVTNLIDNSSDGNRDSVINFILSKNVELNKRSISVIIANYSDMDKMLTYFMSKGFELTNYVIYLIHKSSLENRDKVIDTILTKNVELYDGSISTIIANYSDVDKMLTYFMSKGFELNYDNVNDLITSSSLENRDKVIDTILTKNVELHDRSIVYMITNYSDMDKMLTYFMTKGFELNYDNVYNFMDISSRENRDKIINTILTKNVELTDNIVHTLIIYSSDENSDNVIDTILSKNVKLTDVIINYLINYSSDANVDIVKKKIDDLKQQLKKGIGRIKNYRRLCREQYRKHARYL